MSANHRYSAASRLLPLVLVAMTLLLGSTLTACDLYVDEPIIVDPPPVPWEGAPDGGGGWNCDTNASCAAGCYCNDTGWCEEAGFCETSADCVGGFVCDDRSTCVPEGSPEPAPSCSDLDANESACIAAEACNPVYRGVNCTSDTGAECTAGAESCSCESFLLDRCEEIEPTDE